MDSLHSGQVFIAGRNANTITGTSPNRNDNTSHSHTRRFFFEASNPATTIDNTKTNTNSITNLFLYELNYTVAGTSIAFAVAL